jgi:NRPS condensation-like uncharacterized protein
VMCLTEKDRHDLGLRIHHSVCERFSLNAVLNQLENLYNLQLERNLQPSRFGRSARSLGRIFKLQ